MWDADDAAVGAPAEEAAPAAEAKPEQRLWLHGNLVENPGVLGLGHCARLEAHGDNLRWLLDAHHPCSALTAAPKVGTRTRSVMPVACSIAAVL